MSRVLSELLGAQEPFFSLAIKQLEQTSGNPSVDVRLTAEIVGKVHIKLRSLGLDPADTTGTELHSALVNLVSRHDEFLAKRIGIEDDRDVSQVLARVKQAVDALDVPQTAWVLKHSVAKRLIKAMPPKKVMKQLGYRSVDSMIKRERMGVVFGAMRFIESKDWLDKFVSKYKDLKPSDFEKREIEIIHLNDPRWDNSALNFVKRHRHNIAHLKDMGVVLLLPLPAKRMQGLTIISLALVLYYLNEIRLYSTFFKSQQMKPDFGEILVDTLIKGPTKHASVAGQHIQWRVVHKHFGTGKTSHPSALEPHVEPEDLLWRSAEETLYKLEPALYFWNDIEYVGVMFDGHPVSFNLMDVAVSYVNKLSYGSQAVHHFRSSLWNEIYLRYIGHKAVEKQVLAQFSSGLVEPDVLTAALDEDF